MQFLGNKPKRHYSNMKTLGISIYISYILGLHPWWILHAGRVHWCWTSETLGARHGIIIFFIMSSIWDFISCTTFWISMLLLSQVLVSLQYRVGPLGFLCLPDDQIGGNVGLMDQVEKEMWNWLLLQLLTKIYYKSAAGFAMGAQSHRRLWRRPWQSDHPGE